MSTLVIEPGREMSYEEERGKPMPSKNHAIVQTNLIVELVKHPVRVMSELALRLQGEDFTPDISVYPELSVDFRQDVIRLTEPPMTAVEIFSPRQGHQDVMDKVEVYFESGVKSCWVIAPPLKSITIMLPDGRQQSFDSGVATDPATGLTARVDVVFS